MIICGVLSFTIMSLRNMECKIENPNQLKLKRNDTYNKGEKLTSSFETSNDEDVINKAYLDTNLSKIEGLSSYTGKDYNEFLLHNKEDLLTGRAVRTTIQFLYAKGPFDNYSKGDAHQALKDFLPIQRRIPALEECKWRCQSFSLFIITI